MFNSTFCKWKNICQSFPVFQSFFESLCCVRVPVPPWVCAYLWIALYFVPEGEKMIYGRAALSPVSVNTYLSPLVWNKSLCTFLDH